METLLEDLLMEAGAVEACCKGQLDVAFQSFVGRSRPDAVGIEALVEDEPLVEGFVVEVGLVALNVYLSQTDVAADAVDDLPAGILHLVGEVVEEGVLGAPQLLCLDGQDDSAVVLCPDGLSGNDLLPVAQGDSQCGRRLAVERGMQDDLALVDVGDDLSTEQGILINRLHPYRLPDTGGTGVHALELVQSHVLLAGRLLGGAGVAVGMDNEGMHLSIGEEASHIDGEGGASAEMPSGKPSVDEHLAVVIDGSEIEYDITACPLLRHLNVALIPDVIDKVGVAHAAKLALGAEGNGNLAVEALALIELLLHAGAYEIEGVGPVTIEVKPVLAFKLWARIFRPGHRPSSGSHAE